MKCTYCNDTGKCIKPEEKERFDNLVDREMDKGDFTSREMAKKRILKRFGFATIDCPYCQKEANIES